MLGGCVVRNDAGDAPASLAGTFAGDLPCADCAATHVTVRLNGDGSYAMERAYRGVPQPGDTVFEEHGRWIRDRKKRLALTPDGGERWWLGVVANDTLRMLDRTGAPIDSPMPLRLIRTKAR